MICSTLCFFFIAVLRVYRRTNSSACPVFGAQASPTAKLKIFLNEIQVRVVLVSVFRRSVITRVLTMLCVFTLLMGQAFAALPGYLCRCGGQQSHTQVDHCHGPHSESCHDSQTQDTAQAHLHDNESSGDRENHEPIRKDVELVQSSGIAAPELMTVFLAVLPELPFLGFRTEDTQLTIPWRNVRLAPPPGVVVGRTIVLLM
jgi:hypothetical protein